MNIIKLYIVYITNRITKHFKTSYIYIYEEYYTHNISKNQSEFGHQIFTWQSTVEIFKMAISKILDFSAGSKFAIKLPQDIRYDRESQNCDWVLFSVTPLLNLADSLDQGDSRFSRFFLRNIARVCQSCAIIFIIILGHCESIGVQLIL